MGAGSGFGSIGGSGGGGGGTITGSGTATFIPKFTGATSIGNSLMFDDGKINIISTTEQFRVGYDTSNYLKTTVSSQGIVTQEAIGSVGSFMFNVTGSGKGVRTIDLTSGNAIGLQPDSTFGFPLLASSTILGLYSDNGEFVLQSNAVPSLLYTNGFDLILSSISGGTAQMILSTNGSVSINL